MKFTIGEHSYETTIGNNNFYKIADYAEGRKVFIVTDKNVHALHCQKVKEVLGYSPDHLVLPSGENTKTWGNVEEIINELVKNGCNRNTLLIALGGGVIGDITGFAASVFMRGIDYLQVPTTLLAMVDSSVGGKTGINFGGLKNYVGAFKQPVGVVINAELLETLPKREVLSGMGEMVKTSLLDAQIFRYFTANKEHILNLESPYIEEIIRMCVFIKGGIVMKDEKEKGIRKTLNVGHTVGHALESAEKYRRPHGEYVLSGIFYEANIADRIGIIDKEYKKAIQSAVLSVTPEIVPMKDKQKISDAMRRDKKNEGDGIVFVLPTDYGKVQEVKIKEDLWTS